jgi:hypothetical protein
MKKMTLEKHAKMPASKAHGADAAGFMHGGKAKGYYKGGKTDADMLKMGRGLAKVRNQQTGMKKP